MGIMARKGSHHWVNCLLALSVVVALGLVSSQAADKARISSSDGKVLSPEVNQQQRELEKLLNMSGPKKPNTENLSVPFIPPGDSNPTVFRNKKLEQYMDQQRNWIFLTPQMNNQPLSPEEILGIKNTTPTSDNRSEKTVERYWRLQDKQEQTAANRTKKEDPSEDSKVDPIRNSGFSWNSAQTPVSGLIKASDNGDPLRVAGLNTNSTHFSPSAIADPSFADASFTALLQGASAHRQDPSRTQPFSPGKDFQQLLNPTKPAVPLGGLNDPMNLFTDGSRNSLQPVVASSLDSWDQGKTRRDPFSQFQDLNSPNRLNRLNAFDELNAKVFGSSSLAPTLSTAPASPATQPKPIVFEIPKRKF
jgi:hypothetical protein